VRQFLDDQASDKRQRLVEMLLDHPRYTLHWMNFTGRRSCSRKASMRPPTYADQFLNLGIVPIATFSCATQRLPGLLPPR
jgi:hypothetical protein